MSAAAPERVTFVYAIDNKHFQVTFDASVNEQHGGQAQATEHPVENGPNVTDNIRPMPRKLTLEAVVTNTPIYNTMLEPTTAQAGTFASGNNGLTFPEQFDRVQDVITALQDARKAGALINVTTTLDDYDNMAITNLAIPRNAENSNAVHITIDLSEIILVDVVTVQALSAKHQETNRGTKAAKEVEPAKKEEQSRSMFKATVKAVREKATVKAAGGLFGGG